MDRRLLVRNWSLWRVISRRMLRDTMKGSWILNHNRNTRRWWGHHPSRGIRNLETDRMPLSTITARTTISWTVSSSASTSTAIVSISCRRLLTVAPGPSCARGAESTWSARRTARSPRTLAYRAGRAGWSMIYIWSHCGTVGLSRNGQCTPRRARSCRSSYVWRNKYGFTWGSWGVH